jgi:hypothetical protein
MSRTRQRSSNEFLEWIYPADVVSCNSAAVLPGKIRLERSELASGKMPDKRALKILFDTYWSSTGWKGAGHLNWAPQTPPDDFAHAIDAGVMFSAWTGTHDECLERIAKYRREIAPRDVGAAFIANLSSGSIGLRSALGSYAVALHLPIHPFDAWRLPEICCDLCGAYKHDSGQDVNILSFERHKWGGVRHDKPAYIAFDLERFIAESCESPLSGDRRVFRSMLQCIGSMPMGAKLADLVGSIKPFVSGNAAQRRTVIAMLGFAGVLRIPGRPGFFREFTPASQREETPWYKDDWQYPVRWWRGGHGVDDEAVTYWFGDPN